MTIGSFNKMNTTLQKVADAIKTANDDLYAILKYNVRDASWEIWIDNKPAEVNFKDYDKAEDRCEELNYLYAARKAVEALKGDVPYYECDSMWKNLSSKLTWNLSLNAILK